ERGPRTPPSAPAGSLAAGLAALEETDGEIKASNDNEGVDIAISPATATAQSFEWVSGGHAYAPQVKQFDMYGDPVSGSEFFLRRGYRPIAILQSRLWYAVSSVDPLSPAVGGRRLMIVGRSLHGDQPEQLQIRLGEANGVNALIAGGGFLWLGDSYDGWVYRIDP